jgi:hypothetical protein
MAVRDLIRRCELNATCARGQPPDLPLKDSRL